MLNARIELRGEELFCADTGEGGTSMVRQLTPEALARLRGWAEDYDKAVRSGALPPLVEIGRDIAAFLDEGDRWFNQVLGGTGEIAFEIAVPGRPEERERILLDVPWELLAPNGIFLATDQERLFRVTRRLGGAGTTGAPAHRDLSLLFMATEVEGQGVLNYEQEEAGILQATKGLALNLSVEESGAIEFLGQRIAQDGPFEALHLSCHGDILKGDPVLALEKPEGGRDLAGIAALSEALGEEGKKPGLIFLSACRTGEHGAAAAFVQSLASPFGCLQRDRLGRIGQRRGRDRLCRNLLRGIGTGKLGRLCRGTGSRSAVARPFGRSEPRSALASGESLCRPTGRRRSLRLGEAAPCFPPRRRLQGISRY